MDQEKNETQPRKLDRPEQQVLKISMNNGNEYVWPCYTFSMEMENGQITSIIIRENPYDIPVHKRIPNQNEITAISLLWVSLEK